MKKILLLLFAGLMAIAAVAYATIGHSKTAAEKVFDPEKLNATYYSEARSLSNFKLVDNKGKPFTNENLKGHWSLMFFGFTSCPYICPLTMTELSKVYSKFKKVEVKPEIVMLTIDPERDTIKKMDEYVTAFNENFRGVTGSKDAMDKLAKEMSVLYMRVPAKRGKNSKNYNIDHSASIMIINPQGKLQGFFSMPHEAEDIVGDFRQIINQFS